jgi:hypothetical protein
MTFDSNNRQPGIGDMIPVPGSLAFNRCCLLTRRARARSGNCIVLMQSASKQIYQSMSLRVDGLESQNGAPSVITLAILASDSFRVEKLTTH